MGAETERLTEVLKRARAEVGKVIIGQEHVIDLCLVTIFAGQHALIEGVPGVAKTLLTRTLARVLRQIGEYAWISPWNSLFRRLCC